MRARLYMPRSGDAAALDRILDANRAGNVDIKRDRIVVVPNSDFPAGTLIWRPVGFIHDLHCGTGLGQRSAATALANFAIADGLGRTWQHYDAIFMVDRDNLPMLRFVREMGAVEQYGVVFTLDLAPGEPK